MRWLALIVAVVALAILLLWLRRGEERDHAIEVLRARRSVEATAANGAGDVHAPATPVDDAVASPPSSSREAGAPAIERRPVTGPRLLEQAGPSWKRIAAKTATVATGRFPISRDGIRGAVRSAHADLKDCYEQWLKLNPGIAGRLTIGFTIVPDPENEEAGIVTKVELRDSDVGHVFMESCVLAVFADLRFDAPSDSLEVNYPLVFDHTPEPPQ